MNVKVVFQPIKMKQKYVLHKTGCGLKPLEIVVGCCVVLREIKLVLSHP